MPEKEGHKADNMLLALANTDSSSLETKKKRQIDSHDDILAAIASPSVRRRVETLLDDEVCALQVLASYKNHVMDE
ncbi:hypothetical protein Ae201684P_000131 [Aphanomyces euteiches]|nr:hypothetical protein Ae201684P_000131 [Aphanomyces euteiches]